MLGPMSKSPPQKAFIFDMDGVLIDTERTWVKHGGDFLPNLLGKEIMEKIGSTIGMSGAAIFKKARELGADFDEVACIAQHDAEAKRIYGIAAMTTGIDELGNMLHERGYAMGIVSASRREWINFMLPRLSFADHISLVLSLSERPDLRGKPDPDGYQEAMQLMGVTPDNTIILEDSNSGIAAGKAANAFVIGLRANLVDGYKQEGADLYADSIEDVMRHIASLDHL